MNKAHTDAASVLVSLLQSEEDPGMLATNTRTSSPQNAVATPAVFNDGAPLPPSDLAVPVAKAVRFAASAKRRKQQNSGKEKMCGLKSRSIQEVPRRRNFVNHSYRDFSCVPSDGEELPQEISKMTFPQKVHHMLSQETFKKIISWQPHGRAFRVYLPRLFETKICGLYFGHQRYSSFLRQLSDHSFKQITQGEDRNCFYHELMLRDSKHLCKYMPGPKNIRRLIPDPENEPDFYAISAQYPLLGAHITSHVNASEENTQEIHGLDRKKSLMAPTSPSSKRARVSIDATSESGFSAQLLAETLSSLLNSLESKTTFNPLSAVGFPSPRSFSQLPMSVGLNRPSGCSPQVMPTADHDVQLLLSTLCSIVSNGRTSLPVETDFLQRYTSASPREESLNIVLGPALGVEERIALLTSLFSWRG